MNSIVGIGLGSNSLQAVEIDHSGRTKTVLAMGEYLYARTRGEKSPEQKSDIFSEGLSFFFNSQGFRSKRVSVALDTSSLFLHTLPVEAGLSGSQMTEQLNWELNQYFPETNPKDFITDVHVLSENPAQRLKEILSVSVRRKETARIQRAIAAIGRTVHIVDVDHFASETALRVNYPDTSAKDLALVGIKRHRVDISLLRKGVMESYRYHLVESDAELIEHVGSLSREARGVFSIVAYGPYLDNNLLVGIRRKSNILVEALNPLRHLSVSRTVRLGDNVAGPSYRFAAAIGVALRQD
jgi:Tfp pilus assembly PilM family ATPase